MALLLIIFIGSVIFALTLSCLNLHDFNIKSTIASFPTDVRDLFGIGSKELQDKSNNDKNKT